MKTKTPSRYLAVALGDPKHIPFRPRAKGPYSHVQFTWRRLDEFQYDYLMAWLTRSLQEFFLQELEKRGIDHFTELKRRGYGCQLGLYKLPKKRKRSKSLKS